jgi:mono/diheme cytochrome c family protein
MSKKTDIQNTTQENNLPKYIDRSREQQWLREHGQEFTGQWVALDGNCLICHGANAREVYEGARKSGVKRPLVVEVEKESGLPFGCY